MYDIPQLKKLFNLDTYFSTLNDDLVLMAVTRNWSLLPQDVRTRLREQFQISPVFQHYHALEYYGDIVLTMIVTDELMKYVGVNVKTHALDNIKRQLLNNDYLTSLSRKLNICKQIFSIDNNEALDKHNVCGDTIESMAGLLYFILGMSGLDRIKQWFLSLEPFQKDLDKTINGLLKDQPRDERKFPSYLLRVGNLKDFSEKYVQYYPNYAFQTYSSDGITFHYMLRNIVTGDELLIASGPAQSLQGSNASEVISNYIKDIGLWL
jgi:hypothetical protein